jgi:hypothetical protein
LGIIDITSVIPGSVQGAGDVQLDTGHGGVGEGELLGQLVGRVQGGDTLAIYRVNTQLLSSLIVLILFLSRAKLLVFLTSALTAPVAKSRIEVILNSSVKAWRAAKSPALETVRASTLIWLEGNSLVKKSLAFLEKSVNLAKYDG